MKVTTYSDSNESFRSWTDFCKDELVKDDPLILSSAHGKVANAALEILQAAPSVENKAIFWEWQRQNEFLLQRSGDIYFLYLSKLFTGMFISGLTFFFAFVTC